MVAEFLKLKLRLLGNSFVRSPRHNVGVVLCLLVCLGLAAAAIAVLLTVANGPYLAARTTVVLGGSLVLLAAIVVPLVTGVADTLDPRRFALFGIPADRLARALIVAGLFSVPVFLIAVTALFTIPVWSASVGSALVAALSSLIGIATCVIVSRVTSLLAALGLATRRARETSALIAVLLLVLASPVAVLWVSTNWGRDGSGLLSRAADTLSWTPLGAVWAVPADIVGGESAGAVIVKLLIAVAFPGLVWLAWRALVARAIVTTQREQGSRENDNLGWFGRTPSTRSGAVAARSLTYWARDARYPVPLVGGFIFLLVAYVTFLVVGIPLMVLILLTVPALCITLAFSAHNDVALDNSAVWLHVSAGRVGVADRLGRTAPVLAIGFPLIAVGSVAAAYFAGSFSYLPALLGVSTALLLVGLGVGNLLSAFFPYPAVRPGDSPFAQPQSGGGFGFVVQIAFVVLTFGLSAPSIVLGILAMAGDPALYWASLWWGVGVGLVCLVGGTIVGGAIFDKRGPEILAAALRN